MHFNHLALVALVVASLSVGGSAASYYTRDEYLGTNCPETGFRRRVIAQSGQCASGELATCQVDGSVTVSQCPADICSVPTACPVLRYAPGCYNYYSGKTQYSARVTCGEGVPAIPNGLEKQEVVSSREYSSATCEPAKFTYALYRAPTACFSNYTYYCEAGVGKRQKWADSACTVQSGVATDFSSVCTDGGEIVCSVPTPPAAAAVATIQPNNTVPVVEKILPGPAPTYATRDFYFDKELKQLRSRELSRVGYCDSADNTLEFYRYECLRNGIRKYKCPSSSCSSDCVYNDYITHNGNSIEYVLGAYWNSQYYMKTQCSYVPGAVATPEPGALWIQFAPENKYCNMSSATSPDFQYAFWIATDKCYREYGRPTKVTCTPGFVEYVEHSDDTCTTPTVGYPKSPTAECDAKENSLDPTWKANYAYDCHNNVDELLKYATGGASRIGYSLFMIAFAAFALLL